MASTEGLEKKAKEVKDEVEKEDERVRGVRNQEELETAEASVAELSERVGRILEDGMKAKDSENQAAGAAGEARSQANQEQKERLRKLEDRLRGVREKWNEEHKIFNSPQFNSKLHVQMEAATKTILQEIKSEEPLVLTAVSGVGKTEAAKWLFHRRPGKYELRGWFHAENKEQLMSDYRKWMEYNEGVSRDEMKEWNDERLMHEVNQHLSRLESFLLVLDNAVDPSQVSKLIPVVSGTEQGRKHLIFTSRSKE